MSRTMCMWLGLGLALTSVAAMAQTQTVNGTGTVNTVPMVTAITATTTTIGNSPIAVSGGNVGIGTTTPGSLLDVQNGYILAEGGIISSNRSAIGMEFNKLFNATTRFSVAQSGGGSTLNLANLFDGREAATYFAADPGVVPSASNPYVITVTGLPNVHIQNGAWIGWTSRYNTVSSSFKIEGWDSYAANNWVTFADINDSTDNNGRGYNEYMLKVPLGSYTSLRFTFRNGEQNAYFGLSELFFIHPEATRLYEGLLPSSMWEGINGNVGIGTTSPGANYKLDVAGQIHTSAGLVFPDGSIQTVAYTGTCNGGDYAESVDVAGDRKSYEPGDVLVIGADNGSDVLKSVEPYSTLVAGIYSTKPGTVGRRQTTDAKASKTEIPMALVGIVPTKVSAENGTIKRGDLLVTSSMPGYAMKGTDRGKMLGAVVGKALGALDSGTGVIEVLVTLQ